MNTALWIIQIILGIKLVTVAHTHGLRQDQPAMQDASQKMGRLARPLLSTVAICTFVGTLGLILPGLLGLSTGIISITATLMAIMLLASVFFHIKSREKPKVFVSLILFAFAAFVAYGRWMFNP